MAESSGPFSSIPWNEDQWYTFAPTWAPSGVIGVAGGTDLSLSFSGLTGTIQAGNAYVRGSGYVNDAALVKAVPANTHATLALIGRFVLRRSLVGDATTIQYKAGTPAATPVAPALTQVENGVWEEPLWQFTVPAVSGTAISGITDQRLWTDLSGGRPAWTTLALSGSWVNHGGGTYSLAVSYAASGQVWLRGFIRAPSGASGGSLVATLPVGARPSPNLLRLYVPNASTSSLAAVDLNVDGTLVLSVGLPAGTILTFDTVAYRI